LCDQTFIRGDASHGSNVFGLGGNGH